MSRTAKPDGNRRTVLKGMAAMGALGFAPRMISIAEAQPRTINMQLGWILGGNQIGEVVAKHMGFFAKEGVNVQIQAGGPNIDGIAVVASGRYEIGQVSSSPSIMHAVSQGIPIKCFATGAQEHPFSYFSLKKNPINSVQDMVGKKVGTQGTARILLSALLKKNNVDESKVNVVVIGADMGPLMTGQVDVITGWSTNTTALNALGDQRHKDLRLWDNGVQLYALPYYATTETIAKHGETLAAYIRGCGQGWEYVKNNKQEAVKLLIREYPNLVEKDELQAVDVMLAYVFSDATKKNGWGQMDMAVWENQIKLYDDLKEFRAGAPKLENVATLEILNATKDARPKI